MEVIDGYNFIGTGRQTVATAGTPVQLSSTDTPCRRVTIQAETDNTGRICVGDSNIVETQGSERGIILNAGDAVDVPTSNLDRIYIDSGVNGDGVTFIYYSG